MHNLLDIPYLGRFLRSPWPWRLLRLALLGLLLAMAVFGWGQHAIPAVPARDPLMYTNFATYLFWVLWIMGVVFVAVLTGAQLLGIIGILLALPAAAAGRVALEYYLDKRDGGRGIPETDAEIAAPDPEPKAS